MKRSLSFMLLLNSKEMRLKNTLCFPCSVLSFNNSFWIVEIRLQWWYLKILKFCILNRTLWQAYYLVLPFPIEKAPTKEYHGSLRKVGSRSLNSATILWEVWFLKGVILWRTSSMMLATSASVFNITTYHTMCSLHIVAKESLCFLRYNAVASYHGSNFDCFLV